MHCRSVMALTGTLWHLVVVLRGVMSRVMTTSEADWLYSLWAMPGVLVICPASGSPLFVKRGQNSVKNVCAGLISRSAPMDRGLMRRMLNISWISCVKNQEVLNRAWTERQ